MAAKHVAEYKINLASQAIAENPTITAKEFGESIRCCEASAREALNRARQRQSDDCRNIRERAKDLREKRAVKALEASERQVSDRLSTLRNNAEKLQEIADTTGEGKDLISANHAWKQLTDYERLVTGIAQAEKTTAASAGKTEITLSIPVTPDIIRQIKPVED